MVFQNVTDVLINVDNMKLYILAIDPTRKLKFSSYLLLLSINKMFPYHYTPVILCSLAEAIFEHGCCISALEHNVYIKHLYSSSMYKHNL